jgi:hypothetical protein
LFIILFQLILSVTVLSTAFPGDVNSLSQGSSGGGNGQYLPGAPYEGNGNVPLSNGGSSQRSSGN